ncbi:hypothetical protein DCE93_08490 [Agromyces badenianii]|uniref:DUF4238 domain-containing protein n=1 Tax=Agromyces badenianii TaxID=2080742 RepID=A0A2S0WWH1_9MICO|nr:DUF4238 domain-containing protein [Agromyces badenianii]AWB95697.1 hypothetical protein DCE93_08490 [Agromyces badenianii]
MPNDHHVPRVHLRRFAIPGPGTPPKEWFTRAANVASPDKVFPANIRKVGAEGDFYTFQDFDGEESRDLETFFTGLESDVAGVWRLLLDDPRYALSEVWPLPPRMRGTLAWYLAAQIARTTRQRKRLQVWGASESFTVPGALTPPDLATTHARYIASTLEGIAQALYVRPWGLGFSSACLPTSDCPVVILNAHDDEDQVGAALTWDIVFPLDPHRFIFMPDQQMVEDDPAKRRDHRLMMDGVGLALVDAIYAAADRHIFMHPDHPPMLDATRSPRLPAPGAKGFSPQSVLMYPVLEDGFTVSARWATHHIPAGEGGRRAPFTGEGFGIR